MDNSQKKPANDFLTDSTDTILWSDCPEELYLRRVLEEKQLEDGKSATKEDSLLGDSTVENLFTAQKQQGSVRRWKDWAPIARSTMTEGPGSGATPQSETESKLVVIRPRVLEFDDQASMVTSVPEDYTPTFADVGEETHTFDKGVSTLSGDTGMQQIQPQVDYTMWWIQSDAITYAKPEDNHATPLRLKEQTATELSTPVTSNSKTTGWRSEATDSRCCGFLRRAAKEKVFRHIVNLAVLLFVLFVALSATAMVKSRSFRGGIPSDTTQNEPISPTQPESYPSLPPITNALPGPEPTEAPSSIVVPGPFHTPSPTPSAANLGPSSGLPNPTPVNAPPDEGANPQFSTGAPSGISVPTTDGGAQPTEPIVQRVTDLILEKSPGSLESLGENSSTPQYQALQWILFDLTRQSLSDDRIIQRWVLAVLFYSTSGSDWFDSDLWLSDLDECDWLTTSDSDICDEGGRITQIDLRDNNLEGTVPEELALLSDSLGKAKYTFHSNPYRFR
jgi:hypothetical protein